MNKLFSLRMSLFLVMGFVAGCANYGPAEIHYGEDQCDYCRMNIVDNAFGTEIVTSKGKIFKFDSIECLAAFVQTSIEEDIKSNSLWLTDFGSPGTFVRVDSATLVFSEEYNSPMGVGLVGFGSRSKARIFASEKSGRVLSWEETCLLVAERWKL